MECEFLNEESTSRPLEKLSTAFCEYFPFYLSIGMTYAEYWEGDCSLTQYYRKAFEIKQERENQNFWLQGLYIYDAVSTVVGNVWCRKKGEEASSYPKVPYAVSKEAKERKREIEEKEEKMKARVWMESLVQTYKNI